MPELRDAIREFAPSFELEVDDAVISRLVMHFDLLVRWNAKFNLTRIVDVAQAARFHYLESLWVAEQIGPCNCIVDVGSGAGFPGIPIASARPDVQVVLLEPQVKKATFLRECVRALDLRNVRVRAERFHEGAVTSDDVVVSRAVERLDAVLPSFLASSAHGIFVLTFRELLESVASAGRDLQIVTVPLTTNRALGKFGEISS
jgi:16S rRNA (guanine527-N7)-methyltransferase